MQTTFDVIVCDDIRVEQNGKFILIGVYTGSILVESFENTMSLCFWLRFHGLKPGRHSNTFTIFHNGKILFKADGILEADDAETPQGFLFNVPVKLEKTGKLDFQAEFSDGTIVEASPLRVDLKPEINEETPEATIVE